MPPRPWPICTSQRHTSAGGSVDGHPVGGRRHGAVQQLIARVASRRAPRAWRPSRAAATGAPRVVDRAADDAAAVRPALAAGGSCAVGDRLAHGTAEYRGACAPRHRARLRTPVADAGPSAGIVRPVPRIVVTRGLPEPALAHAPRGRRRRVGLAARTARCADELHAAVARRRRGRDDAARPRRRRVPRRRRARSCASSRTSRSATTTSTSTRRAARGVTVTNTPGVLTDATADLAIALLLAVTRRLGEGERLVRSGEPWAWSIDFMLGRGLRGKTLGIVGYGAIGRATAARARAFGMEVVYTGARARRRAGPGRARASCSSARRRLAALPADAGDAPPDRRRRARADAPTRVPRQHRARPGRRRGGAGRGAARRRDRRRGARRLRARAGGPPRSASRSTTSCSSRTSARRPWRRGPRWPSSRPTTRVAVLAGDDPPTPVVRA